MGVVIVIFFVAAARYIFGNPHGGAGFFTRPFYDPQMWNTKAVLGGTSIAVLTYIGFDGISTLSEEARIRGGTFCWRPCWYAWSSAFFQPFKCMQRS